MGYTPQTALQHGRFEALHDCPGRQDRSFVKRSWRLPERTLGSLPLREYERIAGSDARLSARLGVAENNPRETRDSCKAPAHTGKLTT